MMPKNAVLAVNGLLHGAQARVEYPDSSTGCWFIGVRFAMLMMPEATGGKERYNMFDTVKIGKRIAELRKKRDMTQFEIADRLGISYQAVSNWERGDSLR